MGGRPGLGQVVDAHGAAVVERRRLLSMTSAKKRLSCAVGIRFAVLARGTIDEIEQPIDAMAAERGEHHGRRPRQEVERCPA